jgi:hypothetical protein
MRFINDMVMTEKHLVRLSDNVIQVYLTWQLSQPCIQLQALSVLWPDLKVFVFRTSWVSNSTTHWMSWLRFFMASLSPSRHILRILKVPLPFSSQQCMTCLARDVLLNTPIINPYCSTSSTKWTCYYWFIYQLHKSHSLEWDIREWSWSISSISLERLRKTTEHRRYLNQGPHAITVFWDVLRCGLVQIHWHFAGIFRVEE